MLKKFVITGGPCCGKSTLINKLKGQGFLVLEETAREILEQRKEFPADEKENFIRQQLIFEKQLQREEECNKQNSIVFLDRSVVDVEVYCKFLLGYVPENIANYDLSGRYNGVFILDRMSWIDDGLRIEGGEEQAKKIHEMIYNTYKELRYQIIKVPLIDIGKRIEFIKRFIC